MNTILTRFVKHALITCGGLEILNFRFTMSDFANTGGDNMLEIGEKIKRRRVSLGLTQEELAARVEISKGFISQVERT